MSNGKIGEKTKKRSNREGQVAAGPRRVMRANARAMHHPENNKRRDRTMPDLRRPKAASYRDHPARAKEACAAVVCGATQAAHISFFRSLNNRQKDAVLVSYICVEGYKYTEKVAAMLWRESEGLLCALCRLLTPLLVPATSSPGCLHATV